MLESWPAAVAVGTILGFLSGLGIGGGSLLILWLTMVLGMDHSVARGINLLFFLPSAAIACVFRWKHGAVQIKIVLPAILAGCISTGICTFLGTQLDMEIMKKFFGGLLIATGLRELFYRPNAKPK